MIDVDDREQRSGICDALAALHVPFAIQRLACADYIVAGMIFVERKTVPDFLNSLATHRLFEQVARLCANHKHSILIVEGSHLPGRPSVRGALCALAVEWHLPVLRSSNVAGSAWYLAHIAARCDKTTTTAPISSACAQRPGLAAEQRMLLQVKGIGPLLSAALLQHFGGIHAVLTASATDLQAVPGVGEELAHRLEQLH